MLGVWVVRRKVFLDDCKDTDIVFYAIGYVAYIFDVVADYAMLLVKTLVDVVMNVR